ncbi:MAG: reprolysin-like metallopeptidase [Actinomycetota bacterium]
MRRVLFPLILLVVLLAGLPPAAADPSERKGSFVATAIPYGDVNYSYPTTSETYMCFDGVENVHYVKEVLTAPIDGVLRATMSDFEGDWDLGLFDETDLLVETPWFSQWITDSGKEVVARRVHRGDKITIGACNWLSADTTALVEWKFVPGDGFQAKASSRPFTAIAPGEKAHLSERVPVNFVFLGYDEDDIDLRKFRRGLPARYRPLVRMPAIIYGQDHYLGIDYTYDFRTSFTDRAYEDRFFRELRRLSRSAAPTLIQTQYNAQAGNVRDILTNYQIPASKVERWLVEHAPRGVDPSQNTVFFVNWFGRRDFRHHTYTKYGEPDSDTGRDFGSEYYSQTIAWGGTPPDDPETGFGRTSRVWFYDLSAGPDYWTRNWNVDLPDTDGDGRVNYRMPPAWEYSKQGFRSPKRISGDLSKVARYIAINMLFTTSPLYFPALNAPDLPQSVALDLNTYEGIPGFDASEEWVQEKEVLKSFRAWLPFYELSVDEQDLDFYETQFLGCYEQWSWTYFGPNCHTDKPYTVWANFFVHNALNLDKTADDEKADYAASAFNYAQADGTGWTFGYADDNYLDGTQSFTHTFVDGSFRDSFGMTDIIIHEFGHHFGGSHPHDGYDYERDFDYGPWMDETQFAYAGTQNNSIMSYLSTNNEFSQFDRDNMNRWMTSAYLNAVNEIVSDVLPKMKDSQVTSYVQEADSAAAAAERAFADHDYETAVFTARRAYLLSRAAARAAGVTISGRWTGTKVLEREGASPRGIFFNAREHARYHRMFVDRIDLMKPFIRHMDKHGSTPPLVEVR